NEGGNTKEGILIPNVTAARAKAMGTGVAESTLIYIESGAAEANTTISNVSGKGFYYYDAATTKWTKIGSSSSLGKTIANIRAQQLPMSKDNWKADDYTVVVKGDGAIELPSASENKGR
ncbi:hypothetical protein PG630_10805, partial [Riemerella anatipestifer]|nr:hypothetical protein [Riemerella anatipestifer]